MSGNLLYLSKPSSYLLDKSLLSIQDNYKDLLINNFRYTLPFFSVVKGLDINVLNKTPLTIFISSGQIYIKSLGMVVDIDSSTLTLDKQDLYLIGVDVSIYIDKKEYINPLQGGPILGSIGADREIYKTYIKINDPNTYTIGIIYKVDDEYVIYHIDKKGEISSNRNIEYLYESNSYLDLYKKDIEDFVSTGLLLTETSTSYIISPGTAYINNKRVLSLKPSIIEKNKNSLKKPFIISIDSDGNILLIKDEAYIFPDISYIYDTEGNVIYISREDDIDVDIYIYQDTYNTSFNIYIPKSLHLYLVEDNSIYQYPIFLPSVNELRNIIQGYEYIEKKTLELTHKVNLLTETSSFIKGKFIVLSDFKENSDVNYPGFTSSISSSYINNLSTSLYKPFPFINDLYIYLIKNKIISIYPHWYEKVVYEAQGVTSNINILLSSPTYLLITSNLYYFLLVFNEINLIKSSIVLDNLIGLKTEDGYRSVNNMFIGYGNNASNININGYIYKGNKGINLTLGKGAISQIFYINEDVYSNKVYINSPKSSLILITKDYMGTPDLFNILCWGYKDIGNKEYIEIPKVIHLSKGIRYHFILITDASENSIPITYVINKINGLYLEGFSMNYIGERWIRNNYYLPFKISGIEYKKEESIDIKVDNEIGFDYISVNIDKKIGEIYSYETALNKGNGGKEIWLSNKVNHIDINTQLNKGEYIDLITSDIEIGYKVENLVWISNNYNLYKLYKGVHIYLDIEEEVKVYISSNYGQGWESLEYINGFYSIDNLSNTIGYQTVTKYETLSRTNIKIKIHKEGLLIKPIKMLTMKIIT